MPKLLPIAAGAAIALGAAATAAAVDAGQPNAEIGFLDVGETIKVRRVVVHNADPQGIVLLLHGFPETLYAWQGVWTELAGEYEVHAFDWPGFGLSSRPAPDKFAYAPRDYARVLRDYIEKAGIDRSRLIIYATDIGALPALLAALDEPGIARTIIVGDFAPFDRPAYMQERLQALKSPATAEQVRAQFNAGRGEILENAMRRGLAPEEQFELSTALKADMATGWTHGDISSADAFYHYYSQFTRDQNQFEASLARLKTPVKIIWGARDIYIAKEMGAELAARLKVEFTVLDGAGHYPHLQNPKRTAEEIRALRF